MLAIQPIKQVAFGTALSLASFTVGATPTSRPVASNRDVGVAPTDGYQHAEQLRCYLIKTSQSNKEVEHVIKNRF